MEKKYITTINNKRIYDFYASNPNINIESMNIILLDILEQLGTDMSKIFMNTKLGEISDNIKEIKQQVYNFNDGLANKLSEHNRSFIDTFKLVIGSSNNENNDKIINIINQNTDLFIQKISLTLPKTQEETNRKIQETLSLFHRTITDDIKNFVMTSHSESNLKDFISTLDNKIQIMQQPIYSILSTTQEQIASRINSIKEDNIVAKTNNERIFNELSDFLSKYKNSSQYKGQVSENLLAGILSKLYPTAEITNTTSQTAAADFLLKRENKQNIIFENKCYDRHVNIDEIKKFLRDIVERKCCGVMISQTSGIVGKPDWFIEVHDGKVLIYLHNVQYSPEKIKTAVDIIDNLYERIQTVSQKEDNAGIVIKKEVLDVINEQYQMFISQKENLLSVAREFQRKIIIQIEDLKLPELTAFLNSKYASIQNQEFTCEICNMSFTNNRSLGSHKKMHKGVKPIENKVINAT